MKSISATFGLCLLFLMAKTPLNAQVKGQDGRYSTGRTATSNPSQLQHMSDRAATPSTPQSNEPYVDENGKLLLPLKESPTIEVQEVYESMSTGRQPGLRAAIPHSNSPEVLTNWQLYLKELGIKTKGRNTEMVSENAMLPALSDKPVDLYAVAEPYKGGTYLKVFTNLGGAFLQEKVHPQQFEAAKAMLRDFATMQSAGTIKQSLLSEENELIELNIERDAVNSQIEELEAKLKEYEQLMKEAKLQLNTSQKLKSKKDMAIVHQLNKVEQLKQDFNAVTRGLK